VDRLESLSREELIALVKAHAKSWLAHDGCWFLAAEERRGMDEAIALDTRAWQLFSPAEARRIKTAFNLPDQGGLDALEQALWLRLYACVNPQVVERPEPGRLVLRVLECRVQTARRRKGLKDFPCKSVGVVEYTEFARAIDPRLEVRCLSCPPDPAGDEACVWEFRLP
jgi:hypothetical protein